MALIRNATDKDISSVEYICRMTAGPMSRADEHIGTIMSNTYSTYYARAEQETSFVLDDDGKVVGYILCAPDFRRFIKDYRKNEVKKVLKLELKYGVLAWFIPLAYLPFCKKYPAHLHIDLLNGYRGNGNGTALVATLIKKLKSIGKCGVMLIVDTENKSAQKFYVKNGFHKIISIGSATVMAMKIED